MFVSVNLWSECPRGGSCCPGYVPSHVFPDEWVASGPIRLTFQDQTDGERPQGYGGDHRLIDGGSLRPHGVRWFLTARHRRAFPSEVIAEHGVRVVHGRRRGWPVREAGVCVHRLVNVDPECRVGRLTLDAPGHLRPSGRAPRTTREDQSFPTSSSGCVGGGQAPPSRYSLICPGSSRSFSASKVCLGSGRRRCWRCRIHWQVRFRPAPVTGAARRPHPGRRPWLSTILRRSIRMSAAESPGPYSSSPLRYTY